MAKLHKMSSNCARLIKLIIVVILLLFLQHSLSSLSRTDVAAHSIIMIGRYDVGGSRRLSSLDLGRT